MATQCRRAMPAEVRALSRRWPSLTGVIPQLTQDLERDFRFGHRIAKTERGYLKGGTMKGGSSSVWYPVSSESYEAYQAWKKVEGPHPGDETDFVRLRALLGKHGITLRSGRQQGRRDDPCHFQQHLRGVYRATLHILSCLPPDHLDRPEFAILQIGGWGPDSAKASAYEGGTVYLYDFALGGANRTFNGLLLHEVGHANEHAFQPEIRQELGRHHQVLVEHDAFLGVEFLLDGRARKLYQRYVLNEFLAEMYLLYTACGSALRSFVGSQEVPEVRTAWQAIYDRFQECFGGWEYE